MLKEEQRRIAWIILKTIYHLQAGKSRIASFLRGSNSKIIKEQKLDQKTGFGALFWFNIPTIKGLITQLEEMELIRSHSVNTGYYSYPILVLTEAGKKVLHEKIDVPLQERKVKVPLKIGESELKTLALLKEGRTVLQIAEARRLMLSTIYTHFHRLIAKRKLTAKECVDEEVIPLVIEARKSYKSIKELKQVLPDYVSYNEIRCVLEDVKQNER